MLAGLDDIRTYFTKFECNDEFECDLFAKMTV